MRHIPVLQNLCALVTCEPCKNGWTDRDDFCDECSCRQRKPSVRGAILGEHALACSVPADDCLHSSAASTVTWLPLSRLLLGDLWWSSFTATPPPPKWMQFCSRQGPLLQPHQIQSLSSAMRLWCSVWNNRSLLTKCSLQFALSGM